MKNQIYISVLFLCLNGSNNATAKSDSLVSFQHCKIYLQGSKFIVAKKIWSIGETYLEYLADGSLHDVAIVNVSRVNCGGKDYVVTENQLVPLLKTLQLSESVMDSNTTFMRNQYLYNSNVDYGALGRADADKYYNIVGPITAAFLTAPVLIVPPIIAAVEPNPTMKHNPNKALYYQVPEYRDAYRKRAHGKKALGVLIGTVLCGAIIIAAAQ